MTIKNSEPLSMAEVVEFVEKENEDESNVVGFIKKFNKINSKDAKELKEELNKLEIIKIKTDYIIKMIDLLPETSEELNKIFVDVSLDEDETKKILDTIKKYK
jgi:DNA-directed RNA polymerase subunit F